MVYGKESIAVDFMYEAQPDGKDRPNQGGLAAAPRAAAKQTPLPAKIAGPNSFTGIGSHPRFESSLNVDVSLPKKTFRFTFPNIAHSFWDNYRLTKDYYIRRAEPDPL